MAKKKAKKRAKKQITILRDTKAHLEIAEKLFQESKNNRLVLPSLKEIGEKVATIFGRVKFGVDLGLESLDANVASALAKKRKSKFCDFSVKLNKVKHLSVEAARQLGKNKAPLELDGLVDIDTEVAEALSKHTDYCLSLNGLVEPSEEVLAHLSKHAGPLHLNGLQTLSAKGADLLAKCPGVELSLNGLYDLPIEVASKLRKYKGKKGERTWSTKSTTLLLNGVADLTDDAANEISRYSGILYLEGLTACNDEAGHVALAVRLAGSVGKHGFVNKDRLRLNQLVEITPKFAAGISKHLGGFLDLNGLAQLSAEASVALGAWQGCGYLQLNGLNGLSKEVAEGLVANPNHNELRIGLSMNGLSELPNNIAKILVSGLTSGLYLDGLKTLSDGAASSLAKYAGKDVHGRPGTLTLQGLTNLSSTAAESLKKNESLARSRNSMERVTRAGRKGKAR